MFGWPPNISGTCDQFILGLFPKALTQIIAFIQVCFSQKIIYPITKSSLGIRVSKKTWITSGQRLFRRSLPCRQTPFSGWPKNIEGMLAKSSVRAKNFTNSSNLFATSGLNSLPSSKYSTDCSDYENVEHLAGFRINWVFFGLDASWFLIAETFFHFVFET